jgi:hypothetical protein
MQHLMICFSIVMAPSILVACICVFKVTPVQPARRVLIGSMGKSEATILAEHLQQHGASRQIAEEAGSSCALFLKCLRNEIKHFAVESIMPKRAVHVCIPEMACKKMRNQALRREAPDLSAARRYQILERLWSSPARVPEPIASESSGDPHPHIGDPILVFKKEWLELILTFQKTLEIRHRALKQGTYFLGYKSMIYGVARIADAECISTDERWEALRPQHRVSGQRMYSTTWALRLVDVKRLPLIPYEHKRGAIGIVSFQPPQPSIATRKRPAAASCAARKRPAAASETAEVPASSDSSPSAAQESFQQAPGRSSHAPEGVEAPPDMM